MAQVDFELRPSQRSDPGTGFLRGSIARDHLPGALEVGPLAYDEDDKDDGDDETDVNLCLPPTTDQCPVDPP